MVATARRTQQERRDHTRAALLDAATAAIVEKGPSVGVAEIAERAGVSKGAIQHHFETKADLLAAVVALGWHPNEPAPGVVTAADSPAPMDRLRSLVAEMWQGYQRPAFRAAFVVASDPRIDRALATRVEPIFHDARRDLDGRWRATFRDLGADDAALDLGRRFVRSHLLGMLIQRQMPTAEPMPDEELEALCVAALAVMAGPAR